MEANRYLKPAWTHNGSVKTDLPLTVISRKKKKLIEAVVPGQLFCVGEVYIKTEKGSFIRLK